MKTILLSAPPCPPQTWCWCQSKPPNHPCHNSQVGVPINLGLGFLLLAGLILGLYKLMRK